MVPSTTASRRFGSGVCQGSHRIDLLALRYGQGPKKRSIVSGVGRLALLQLVDGTVDAVWPWMSIRGFSRASCICFWHCGTLLMNHTTTSTMSSEYEQDETPVKVVSSSWNREEAVSTPRRLAVHRSLSERHLFCHMTYAHRIEPLRGLQDSLIIASICKVFVGGCDCLRYSVQLERKFFAVRERRSELILLL